MAFRGAVARRTSVVLLDAGVGNPLGDLALKDQEDGQQRQDAEDGGGHGLGVLDR
jgi:hypothetical protein